MGKTNIIEAVYYLCLGKSYFASMDKYIFKEGADFFRIEGIFHSLSDQYKIVIKSKLSEKKVIEVNGKKIEKIHDLVGKIPCVIIAPDDVHEMLETSETRRNFINNILVQIDAQYLEALLMYNALLKQRNAYLKSAFHEQKWNKLLFDTISERMVAPSQIIHDARARLIVEFKVIFREMYQQISGGQEVADVNYFSALTHSSLIDLFHINHDKDRLLKRTTQGIHKDDLIFLLNGHEVKNYASQGQIKSFVLALKIAQYNFIKQKTKNSPLVLLDDIFDKLDLDRVSQAMKLLSGLDNGQIFITDTQKDRVETIMSLLNLEAKIFEIQNGAVL